VCSNQPKTKVISIFIAAAMLDDVETCERAIKVTGKATWPTSSSPGTLQNPLGNQDVFDLLAMPFSRYIMIPRHYSFALMRVRLVVGTTASNPLVNRIMTDKERFDCAEEFARLMGHVRA
jgi:hypothetical protein